MRKKILAISIISLMLLTLSFATACSFQLPHSHQYNERVATADYLKSEATCGQKAIYYFSCDCGKKGTQTFEYGEAKPHEHTILKHDAENHWYECECGDALSATAHTGSAETCGEQAVCEVCEASFGEVKPHEHTILKSDAENHWYECWCGYALEETAHDMFYGACRDCDFETKISVSNVGAQAGQEVTLAITLAGSPGLAGLELTITYDQTQITLTSVEDTGILAGLTCTTSANLISGSKVLWDGEDASYANGEILELNFVVADTATSGNVEVEISALGYDQNIEKVYFVIYNGTIAIG